MKYNPQKHKRRSIRLKGYDYSQAGLYFVTFCVQNRQCLFGSIVDGKMILNDAGKSVENEWLKLPKRFTNINLHEYIVMPNHFHAILEIVGATIVVDPNKKKEGKTEEGQPQGIAPTVLPLTVLPPTVLPLTVLPLTVLPPTVLPLTVLPPTGTDPTDKTLGDILGAFKSISTLEYIRGVKKNNWPFFKGKLWQRNYWEHIVRNEGEYMRISQYIIDNAQKWQNDKLNGGDGNKVM